MKIKRTMGPKINNYIGPSGKDYSTTIDIPFEVNDQRDFDFFKKRKSFEVTDDTITEKEEVKDEAPVPTGDDGVENKEEETEEANKEPETEKESEPEENKEEAPEEKPEGEAQGESE